MAAVTALFPTADAYGMECIYCPRCRVAEPNTSRAVEVYEVTGEAVCDDCADAVLEEFEADEDSADDCCPGCGACPGFTGVECDETCEWATTGPGAA